MYSAGWMTSSVRHPSTGGVAQKRTSGSTLYLPSREARERGFGMPGSIATRSPGLRCSTPSPTSSTVPEASWPRIMGCSRTNCPIRPCV